ENVSHSLCSLEFENHRPLYDWLLDHLPIEHKPRQIEFARLNITYTVLSKRFLKELVERGLVDGWDDPRMPTLRGMRRRGFTPNSIRNFCSRIGLARTHSTVELSWLEDELRKDLNPIALRRMAVLDPLKVVIENIAGGEALACQADNNPEDPDAGTREIFLTREVWIEREDFREEANRKFFRLKTDGLVRLRYGYVIHCHGVVKDSNGNILELRCTYNPETGSGKTPEGMAKVKGIIHWVSARDAVPATVRLYDALFTKPNPMADGDGGDFWDHLNPEARVDLENCQLEAALGQAQEGESYQFERMGYFVLDPSSDGEGKLVFNRSVSLRDQRAKSE
ncbi:MAG: glutamine--tRNA ligase, partial [Planctomycetes bacterium]|nr:glutamine--tRNA ligase [Planctomycetota bacterium]